MEKIAALINFYADKGAMLPRTIPFIYQKIREYTVIEDNGSLIAVGSLHILWNDLAEICSLAVRQENTNKGMGSSLVKRLIQEARELEIKKIFTLTYQPVFFEKCGFHRINKDNLPQKVWTECINCPKFPNCDEIALIRTIDR